MKYLVDSIKMMANRAESDLTMFVHGFLLLCQVGFRIMVGR